MKKATHLAIILALAISALASCAGGGYGGAPSSNRGEPPSPGDPAPAAQSQGEPAPAPASVPAIKEEVVIGFPEIPAHFDPLQGFGGGGHSSGAQLLFSTLVEVDENSGIAPGLAESYAISEDALVYTFSLRKGARFSDGADVTAGDVAFTFKALMDSASPIDLSCVQSVSADGDAVTITLSRPQSTFILAAASAGIVPEHAYGEGFGLNPIGSGPYRLAQYDVDQQFILEASETYYGPAPKIKRAVFVKIADADVRLAAVMGGQVDITAADAALAGAVGPAPGYKLLVADTVDNLGIAMPTVPYASEANQYGHPVGNDATADASFRKALAYGLDREAICRDALNGFASPSFSENDGLPWSNPDSAIEYDLGYAISLLEQSGWAMGGDGVRAKDGARASLTLLYFAGDSTRQAVAMAAAQQAREKLGIEIAVEGAASVDIASRMYSEPIMLAWGSANPMTSYYLFHSSHAGLDDWYNPQNYRSAAVDGYLEQAVGARTIEEAARYFRLAQWDGSSGTSMRGDCPYIFLVNVSHLYWVREGLDTGARKIHAHGGSWPLVENLREWEWAWERAWEG